MGRSLLLFFLFCSTSIAQAQPPVLPESLQPWASWVLRDQPDARCPHLAAAKLSQTGEQKVCAWPGKLSIQADAKGMHFKQQWTVYGESWVRLPGDKKHWPKRVLSNNKLAPVLDKSNVPSLLLGPGKYQLEGQIEWRKIPQHIPVPPETALLDTRINGRALHGGMDAQGRLWLEQRNSPAAQQVQGDSIKVEVFRRLSDDVPMRLLTELRLAVSGNPRELLLGQLLPQQAQPVHFESPLPARIEQDGRLRIQLRPGQWVLSLDARYLNAPDSFAMQRMDDAWPAQETWSFQARPSLRGVKLSGLPALDPSQINLPKSFTQLPTYLMSEGASLSVQEQYRGDATPAANELSLKRTLWLDFDGAGVTLQDQITGSMTQGWRLQVDADMLLGRVSVDGRPQLVTQLIGAGDVGVELRKSAVNVEAVSRSSMLREFSASGWQQDFKKLSIVAHLPPGWQLWHASGPDHVSSSWLSRWDLWDVFLCLLIISSVGRLLGWRWSAVALLALALTYHVSGSPLVSWVVLIIALSLLRVLPLGWLRRIVVSITVLTLLSVTLIGLDFAVTKIRQALYPQLELHQSINTYSKNYAATSAVDSFEVEDFAAEAELMQAPQSLTRSKAYASNKAGQQPPRKKIYQAQLNVQTGPGLPTWQWRRVNMSWSGPVHSGERVHLYLSPPWLTRLLYLLQVLLVGTLIYALARALVHELKNSPPPTKKERAAPLAPLAALLVPLLMSMGLLQSEESLASTYPSESMLQQLQQELLKPPTCLPHCIALQQVDVSAGSEQLTLILRVTAAADVAVPLPYADAWSLQQASLNTRPVALLKKQQKNWIQLPRGAHSIKLQGRINADQLTLTFPVTPHNMSVSAPLWNLSGLVNGGLSGRALQLRKQQKEQQKNTLLPAPIKPFAIVERQFDLDVDWMLTTRVKRIAPEQGAINLRIPLLPGESVISSHVTIEQQQAVVALDGSSREISWQSVLQPVDILELTASDNHAWTEVWKINPSERWHITSSGLVATKSKQGRIWQPRAGERLQLSAVQPAAVEGPTTTVESARAVYRPGTRSAELDLELAIRTSLGGDYPIKLLTPGQLKKISIDGEEQTRPKDAGAVIVTLRPGLQRVKVQWELAEGVSTYAETPLFELPSTTSNIDLRLELPRSRWPLLVGGPDIGPAMLFWGVLLVICAVALVLGRVVKRLKLSIPLTSWSWLLLAVGVSTVSTAVSIPIVLWFFALEARSRLAVSWRLHNVVQVLLIVLTVVAVTSLCVTIPQSLLSTPNMQVTGNGSSNYIYNWYQDHSLAQLPVGWVYSVPLWLYRVAMLLWSLWLVFALLRWAKWGWQCFSAEGVWRQAEPVPPAEDPEKE